jgi:hypothetical protein
MPRTRGHRSRGRYEPRKTAQRRSPEFQPRSGSARCQTQESSSQDIDKEVAKDSDRRDGIIALLPDYASHDLTKPVDAAGPPIVHRRAFANALWRSTTITGLEIPQRTFYTRWSPAIWKRFSPGSASAIGTSRVLWSANSDRSWTVACWHGVLFAFTAAHAVWIVWSGFHANGGASVTRVEIAGWQIRRPTSSTAYWRTFRSASGSCRFRMRFAISSPTTPI